jgi:hypothetical protein
LNFKELVYEQNSVFLAWWERSERYRAKEREFCGLMASAEKKGLPQRQAYRFSYNQKLVSPNKITASISKSELYAA